ncbi:MAG: membrane protein insertase YidC [Zetaproteobacteria bacterium CG_4_9_14_3_um_filter_49_83]|nr:MAG: hypothetical protein AUJ56_07615 [Zetaproteobacteria bacterium CG1_02_49_23]PIQ29903.1 MAG: membrane protein insertase YidC [Zetaproteobacteria bacterium CG17_big_fil_post_rev_8_21_14_2_50_50_13]PIV31032.1 MAG: membrane protein insertase YidC [Zetaproteobacteria bacterium CG02_land_8_20_14_3_00_50_9]PIY55215.1 MAG: membrane protein insertase YidC [Zetaproteobacteria bacterium CG_4_10_14_0_8_um_filter_49_80]PJA36221.1 MAG: membrane protein insertase YidC [Zetaproteobacteria bacterium CG_
MEQRNVLIFFVLSIMIFMVWGELFPNQTVQDSVNVSQQQTSSANATAQSGQEITLNPDDVPELRPSDESVNTASVAKDVQPQGQQFVLQNDRLRMSMDDRGWITDAEFLQYTDSIESGSPQVHMFTTSESIQRYFNAGLIGSKRTGPFVKISESSVDGGTVFLFHAPVEQGKQWQRQITLIPGSYLIHLQDRIIGGAGIKMFRQVVERNPDRNLDTFYEHVGPIGFLNHELKEVGYDDLDDDGPVKLAAIGGWTGMMNRYFIAAMVGNSEQDYRYYYKGDGRSYQSGVLDDGIVEDNGVLFDSTLYVGPKSISLLRGLNLDLERSVDYGYFAFIAKPMHDFMMWMNSYISNFGFCIILLVVAIKILFFYPTQKAYESMASMRKIQPEMVRLKDLYGDDRQKMGQEMMKLYKKHKVNPMGGCLPILIQIPVFFALYKVLLMSIEMRQAPFIGWIHDLSVQDPYFVLPVAMGLSMFIQQKLNPQPTDPMQAKVLQFLPPVFTIMFLFFPSGLVLYWLVNNILSIAQQYYVLKVKDAI